MSASESASGLSKIVKILILNQTFYPDVVATAHYASHLAAELASQGYTVSVLTGLRAYDNPSQRFPSREVWRGVGIRRIFTPGLGKRTKWRRLADFVCFLLGCAWRLLWMHRNDVVVALTSPPLIAFLAGMFVRLKGGKLLYWVMDLNPDQAIAAGMLRPGTKRAKVLESMLRGTLRASSKTVVLDRFMEERLQARGLDSSAIATIPPWSHNGAMTLDHTRRDCFRREHGIDNKFVVMYAGNHSPCHPLDTLIAAAESLAAEQDIVFCFVGGGTEHQKVSEHATRIGAGNVICLPYPPKEQLADPLFAADLHVVVMGDSYVGIVHPCKVYNILALGTPLLYIGPLESHVTDLAAEGEQDGWFYPAPHGAIRKVIGHIRRAKKAARLSVSNEKDIAAGFSQSLLLGRMMAEIRSLAVPVVPAEAPQAATAESEI